MWKEKYDYLCSMDKETYEKQKAFAGKKIPSMNRRCVGHDYQSRQIYMITMVTEGRRPLFGRVVGRSDAVAGEEAPHIVLSVLGEAVVKSWMATHDIYPAIEVIALQMMPDHLHGIPATKPTEELYLGRLSVLRHCRNIRDGESQDPRMTAATACSLLVAITTVCYYVKDSLTTGSTTSPTTRGAC